MTMFDEYPEQTARPAPTIIDRDAFVSEDQRYRYLLTRTWDATLPTACWVMLNPSTADALEDDPTIRRCVSFSDREGCGSLAVVNLYAWRSTHPNALQVVTDPVGPLNVEYVSDAIGDVMTSVVIVAWGASTPMLGHGQRQPPNVSALAESAGRSLVCLGTTQNGAPRHPLYVKGDTPLVPWPAT